METHRERVGRIESTRLDSTRSVVYGRWTSRSISIAISVLGSNHVVAAAAGLRRTDKTTQNRTTKRVGGGRDRGKKEKGLLHTKSFNMMIKSYTLLIYLTKCHVGGRPNTPVNHLLIGLYVQLLVHCNQTCAVCLLILVSISALALTPPSLFVVKLILAPSQFSWPGLRLGLGGVECAFTLLLNKQPTTHEVSQTRKREREREGSRVHRWVVGCPRVCACSDSCLCLLCSPLFCLQSIRDEFHRSTRGWYRSRSTLAPATASRTEWIRSPIP